MGEAPPAPSELFYTEGGDDLRVARLEVGVPPAMELLEAAGQLHAASR